MAPSDSQEPCSLAQLLVYFLRLGTLGFGGADCPAGRMDRDLVEERRWVSRQDYVEGLAFSQLSPGPLAAQLAMYIGWVRAGRAGAALVAAAFVVPLWLSFTRTCDLNNYRGSKTSSTASAPPSSLSSRRVRTGSGVRKSVRICSFGCYSPRLCVTTEVDTFART